MVFAAGHFDLTSRFAEYRHGETSDYSVAGWGAISKGEMALGSSPHQASLTHLYLNQLASQTSSSTVLKKWGVIGSLHQISAEIDLLPDTNQVSNQPRKGRLWSFSAPC